MASLWKRDVSRQDVQEVHGSTEVDAPGGSLLKVNSLLERPFEAHLSVAALFGVTATLCAALNFPLYTLTGGLVDIVCFCNERLFEARV